MHEKGIPMIGLDDPRKACRKIWTNGVLNLRKFKKVFKLHVHYSEIKASILHEKRIPSWPFKLTRHITVNRKSGSFKYNI